MRDDTLVELGIRLEDKPDGSSVWKPEDPAVLRAEQQERQRAAAEARSKKLRSQLDLKTKVGGCPDMPRLCLCRRLYLCVAVSASGWVQQRKACAPSTHVPLQELEKFEKLAALPSVQEALADKYSQWDPGGLPYPCLPPHQTVQSGR